jgi:hypothetical protein
MTLRLSSACSNQLSYAPRLRASRYSAASLAQLACRVEARRLRRAKTGGADEDRTRDLLLAKQALSQLSYGPVGLRWAAALPQKGFLSSTSRW